MNELPFPLETFSVITAEQELSRLRAKHPELMPVLLGDGDIFSAEWAETVDDFADPEEILIAAYDIDVDAWFAARQSQVRIVEDRAEADLRRYQLMTSAVSFPVDLLMAPLRLGRWAITGERPRFFPGAYGGSVKGATHGIAALKQQLNELEGEGLLESDLIEARAAIAAVEADGAQVYPDPVYYVTPRHGSSIAAALLAGQAPWECAAWLQHGTYAFVAPKPVLVAYCRWLWNCHGARIITASMDHIGFEVSRPILHPAEAREVVDRFVLLGANEVNADYRGSSGESLIGAQRWWVWWD